MHRLHLWCQLLLSWRRCLSLQWWCRLPRWCHWLHLWWVLPLLLQCLLLYPLHINSLHLRLHLHYLSPPFNSTKHPHFNLKCNPSLFFFNLLAKTKIRLSPIRSAQVCVKTLIIQQRNRTQSYQPSIISQLCLINSRLKLTNRNQRCSILHYVKGVAKKLLRSNEKDWAQSQ